VSQRPHNEQEVHAALAEAIRVISAAYSDLPEPVQERLDVTLDGIEGEVDAAILAGEPERAQDAIRAWRGYWLDRFERAVERGAE
jgi:hypothetical protein